MDISTNSRLARRLGSVLEPVVGQVYFSPECHANYVALGFDPSPGDANGVALPDGPAYFASRGSLLGQVPGEVVAAAFGVFSPAVVVPSVRLAWTRTDAPTIRAARADGAVAQLRRLLGDRPDGVERALALLQRAAGVLPINGRHLAAGIAALEVPDDPLAATWHVGDFLREYRGDCHNAAWVAAGLTAADIGILTELSWGMPMRSYSRTRGWTDEEFDRSEHRLRDLGLLDGSGRDTHLSQQGRHAREQIEVVTDDQMRPALDALGEDIDELVEILAPWGETIRAGKGYLGAGPHDLGG
jgi:Helix-turn-helix family